MDNLKLYFVSNRLEFCQKHTRRARVRLIYGSVDRVPLAFFYATRWFSGKEKAFLEPFTQLGELRKFSMADLEKGLGSLLLAEHLALALDTFGIQLPD